MLTQHRALSAWDGRGRNTQSVMLSVGSRPLRASKRSSRKAARRMSRSFHTRAPPVPVRGWRGGKTVMKTSVAPDVVAFSSMSSVASNMPCAMRE